MFKGFQKIFTTDAGLTANCPQRGTLDVPVIWHGQWRAGAVGILADQRNVLALLNHFKTQGAQCGQYFGLGSVHGKFHKLDCRFGDVGIQCGIFGFQRFTTKGFDVEADGALNIVQGFVKRISFADDDTLDADGIGNVTIGVFFNDNFHSNNMPLPDACFKWMKMIFL